MLVVEDVTQDCLLGIDFLCKHNCTNDLHGKSSLYFSVHPVLVVEDVTQDCLLGIDFLCKHNCTNDLHGKSIKTGKEVVSLKGKND